VPIREGKADSARPEAMSEGVTDSVAIGKELHRIKHPGDAAIELAHEKNFKLTRPWRERLKIGRIYVRRTLGYGGSKAGQAGPMPEALDFHTAFGQFVIDTPTFWNKPLPCGVTLSRKRGIYAGTVLKFGQGTDILRASWVPPVR
jgi:hypothetical protein